MRTASRQGAAADTAADTLCLGLFEDEGAPEQLDQALGGALGRLIESGEAKGSLRKSALLHPGEGTAATRVITVGLGKRKDYEPERARVAAAVGLARARDAGSMKLAWAVPDGVDQHAAAAAVTEGVVLAAYRFDRFKSKNNEEGHKEKQGPEALEVVSPEDVGEAVAQAALVAGHQNEARNLQNLPANELTSARLAEHALARADEIDGLEVEVIHPDRIEQMGMGGLLGVAKGSHEQPRLIVMRYGTGKEPLAFVGKAVTFDTGGISIKPAGKMEEMKMDMSGGATVIEATAAIARLKLPVTLLTIVPATENMPSGHAIRPGDIVEITNGKTVEVNNTDAEGRLILADALAYAASQDAGRIVDLATLTGAIIVALGSSYAGLFSNDDALSADIQRAADDTAENVWRMPLHADFKDLVRGKVADLVNVSDQRKASSAYAASFLEEFVNGKPWAHLDIAGVAWGQDNRDYVGKGASGWGVRLLVDLARGQSQG